MRGGSGPASGKRVIRELRDSLPTSPVCRMRSHRHRGPRNVAQRKPAAACWPPATHLWPRDRLRVRHTAPGHIGTCVCPGAGCQPGVCALRPPNANTTQRAKSKGFITILAEAEYSKTNSRLKIRPEKRTMEL